MDSKFDKQILLNNLNKRPHKDIPQSAMHHEAISAPGTLKYTMFDLIKAMNEEELADFFFQSPEIEFGVCAFCDNFTSAGSPEPCSSIYCDLVKKNKAFKKFLKQEVKYE